MKHSKIHTRALVGFVAVIAVTCSLDAVIKRFDASEPSRQGYLRSFRPANLSFKKTIPVPADRHFLLYLPEANASTLPETNATYPATAPELAATPLEPAVPTSPAVGLPPVSPAPGAPLPSAPLLPPADPFEEVSTDDLVNELEGEHFRAGSGGSSSFVIPFIPPYSMAPADFELRTRARYVRRPRP